MKYADSENMKADRANTVVFKLNQIKRRVFFFFFWGGGGYTRYIIRKLMIWWQIIYNLFWGNISISQKWGEQCISRNPKELLKIAKFKYFAKQIIYPF